MVPAAVLTVGAAVDLTRQTLEKYGLDKLLDALCGYDIQKDMDPMKNFQFQFSLRRLKGNALVWCSTLAALCLFFNPNVNSLLFSLLVSCAALAACMLFDLKPPVMGRPAQAAIAALAAFLELCRLNAFYHMWMGSRKAGALAALLHLPKPVLVMTAGVLGCAVGFYTLYLALALCLHKTVRYIRRLTENTQQALKNFRSNWFLPLSSAAFGCLEVQTTFVFWTGLLFAVLAAFLFACKTKPLEPWSRKRPKGVRLLAFLASTGVCWRGQQYAYIAWSPLLPELKFSASVSFDCALAVSLFLALGSFAFVYFGMVYIWKTVWRIAKTAIFSEKRSMEEFVIYAVLMVVILRFAAAAFMASNAYYGGRFDVIYTSDSPSLDINSAYLFIKNGENDLRQPLFAVFSAPFMGIPYLIGTILLLPQSKIAILMNSVQILMLFFSYFLLGNTLQLRGLRRVCFMLLCCSTYTFLLFSLMMEQYIVAFFWLSAVVYQACEEDTCESVVLWGAGGSMLTSMACLPLSSKRLPGKDFREWWEDLIRHGLGFIALMIAFYRFDVIYGLKARSSFLLKFTGQNVAWSDKILQYLAFPRNCLFAPQAGIQNNAAWRLSVISGASRMGIAMLLLVAAGFALNWEKKSCRIAVFWVLFSVVMLILLGWGTAENGLNLYALYFGWAYFILLFQLVDKVGEMFRLSWLLPTVSAIGTLTLLSVNIPAIHALVSFAAAQYPA